MPAGENKDKYFKKSLLTRDERERKEEKKG
jgi:hypothetical protein